MIFPIHLLDYNIKSQMFLYGYIYLNEASCDVFYYASKYLNIIKGITIITFIGD